jgi:beta-glucosidase
VENRLEDLLARLTLEDKAGPMFHDIVAMLPGGRLIGADNPFGRPATDAAIRQMRMNHFNLAGGVDNVRDLVAWHNQVQELALATGPGPRKTAKTRTSRTAASRSTPADRPSTTSNRSGPRSRPGRRR